jgi:hypothetical protein
MTPRQLHLLIDRERERMTHQELLAGIIASQVVNSGARTPDPLTVPADFMPSRRERDEKPKPITRTQRAKVANDIRALFASRHAPQAK